MLFISGRQVCSGRGLDTAIGRSICNMHVLYFSRVKLRLGLNHYFACHAAASRDGSVCRCHQIIAVRAEHTGSPANCSKVRVYSMPTMLSEALKGIAVRHSICSVKALASYGSCRESLVKRSSPAKGMGAGIAWRPCTRLCSAS